MGRIIASATGRYITTCKFCTSAIADTPPLDVPPIGEPGKKAEALMTILVKHLMREHPDQFARGMEFNRDFPAFLILQAFQFEDPSITGRLETMRAGIFQLVRKNSFTDDKLKYIISALGLEPCDAESVFVAMQALRDACCEIGQHALIPPPSIVTA